jgi:hypothetical protein
MGTATNDYLVRAVSGPAGGYGLHLDAFEGQPAAISRPAESSYQVVISCCSQFRGQLQ